MITRSNDPGLDVSSIYNLQVTKTNDVHRKKCTMVHQCVQKSLLESFRNIFIKLSVKSRYFGNCFASEIARQTISI